MVIDKNTQVKLEFIEQYKKASNAATGSKFDANSNVTEKNIATMGAELPKKDNTFLKWKGYCLEDNLCLGISCSPLCSIKDDSKSSYLT